MKNTFVSAVFFTVTVMLFLPGQSLAATLGLSTHSPTLEAGFAFIDYLEFGFDGDLSTFAEVDAANGVSPVGFTELGFGMGFALADPTVGATGGFDIFDEGGSFLAGDLIAVGFTEDVIELQFGSLSGAGAVDFGTSVLMEIVFDDPLGPNPFDSLVDGEFYSASITVSDVASVPVPAALPLFLSAIFGLGWIGRKTSTA